MDPYEQRYVEVRKSTIHNAGEGVLYTNTHKTQIRNFMFCFEGVFATRDLSVGVLACYYNGALVEHRVVDNVRNKNKKQKSCADQSCCSDRGVTM
jgi:hypothetical protein